MLLHILRHVRKCVYNTAVIMHEKYCAMQASFIDGAEINVCTILSHPLSRVFRYVYIFHLFVQCSYSRWLCALALTLTKPLITATHLNRFQNETKIQI